MEALLITRADIVKFTALNGNVDTDNFIQWVKVAQDIHIQNYLGSKLFEKIKTEIVANTLAEPYLSLVNNFVKPMLIHWAMVEYLPFAAYTIASKGVFKHSSENAVNVEKNEVDFLVEKERKIAQGYSERFVGFICNNYAMFPEYNTNTGADMRPDKDVNLGGWFL